MYLKTRNGNIVNLDKVLAVQFSPDDELNCVWAYTTHRDIKCVPNKDERVELVFGRIMNQLYHCHSRWIKVGNWYFRGDRLESVTHAYQEKVVYYVNMESREFPVHYVQQADLDEWQKEMEKSVSEKMFPGSPESVLEL